MKFVRATLIVIISLVSFGSVVARDFKIISNNTDKRAEITDTVHSGDFIIGVNDYGGGYITQIGIPGIGNIMGDQAQRYGRGAQSSIRDMARKGQYNPTQAGFSDMAGTECKVTKTPGKIVVDPRGCVLFNGDGGFDYVRWENIKADPYNKDGGNSDKDNLDEENLSVTIDGKTFTKQEAEVHSDFDYYGEYEDYKGKLGLSIPAVRHYFEYRFVRSTTLPNACMKQFNKASLVSDQRWEERKLPADISTQYPKGVYEGGADNLNSIILSWSIRNDIELWDPAYRYQQFNNGDWQVKDRSEGQFQGKVETYKLRFIIAESNDENKGKALGFYLPESHLNTFNCIGIRESDGNEVYADARTTSNFYLDVPHRTPTMSWIGFRSELKGLIDRSKLDGAYEGVYEKLRQEIILLYGTPAEIKAAFAQLDKHYANIMTLAQTKD